ncbi:MAG: hypothetical protein AAF411_30315 [Myxococcota bacterium]
MGSALHTALAFSALAFALTASEVSAQTDREVGEAAFRRGLEAEDPVLAAQYFRESYEVDPNSRNAFVLATTLHRIGRNGEALELLERLAANELAPPLDDGQLESVARLRASAEASLVEVRVECLTGEGRVRVDGVDEGLASPESPLELRLDPGRHTIRSGVSETVVATSARSASRVVLDSCGMPPLGPSEVQEPTSRPPRRALRNGLLVAGGVVVAVAVVLAVVLTRSDSNDLSRFEDPVFGIVRGP